MSVRAKKITELQDQVWTHFATHRRQMSWRENPSPYWVMVSEIMLQQTQVDRVRPKFEAFVTHFPDIACLAAAPLAEVLTLWVGLGYNRRAKFLHLAAKEIMERHNGHFPQTAAELIALPGIGPNTAGAILAYAYNQPVVFVETNIRSVMLHHFFADKSQVDDRQISELAAATLDATRPREWYWALMDYGTYLKKTYGNNVQRAKSYRRQSTFAGSHRQVRGQVIKLLAMAPISHNELVAKVADERLPLVLAELEAEKLITMSNNRVQLAQ